MSMPDAPALSIRPLRAWQEYLAAEELQRIVWQMPDWRDVVPANLLITAHKNGGILLGAFDTQANLVGFVFSFIGVAHASTPPVCKHCSHMLAVLPAFQGKQIGLQLKFAQRDLARAQGISLMTWTYDPLLALNARLNLHRLGAIAHRYLPDAYGTMTDALNAGLPSDRFEVEWWLASPRVTACAPPAPAPTPADWDALIRAGAQAVCHVTFDAQNLPHLEEILAPCGDPLLVEIPTNLAALKLGAPESARQWRRLTRDWFQRVFAAGYIASDFVAKTHATQPRAAYVLTRRTPSHHAPGEV